MAEGEPGGEPAGRVFVTDRVLDAPRWRCGSDGAATAAAEAGTFDRPAGYPAKA